MRSRLDQIEARLQTFIESSLNLLPGNQRPIRLIHQLVQALEQTITPDAAGSLSASSAYIITLHPQNAAIWQADPNLLPALSQVLSEAVRETGVQMIKIPTLQLVPDAAQAVDSFTITAVPNPHNLEQTGVLLVGEQPEASGADTLPRGASLIAGNQTIPLRLAVINMGRKSDNQLVVDDARVSRTHAQLRLIHGKYALFDLNSTGGTFINNLRISQQVVKPGDVISLAGFTLIYVEDFTPPGSRVEDTGSQTTELNP